MTTRCWCAKIRHHERQSGFDRLGVGGGASVISSAAGVIDASIGGTIRPWTTARSCSPLRIVVQHDLANPFCIVDEAGAGGDNGAVQAALLGMLGPGTSVRHLDPLLETAVDLSRVIWFLTANDLTKVTEQLRYRCRGTHVPEPEPEHMAALTCSVIADHASDRGLDGEWAPG